MKKLFLGLALAAFILAPAAAQIKLDVKTKFLDKFEIKGLKHGVIYYLEQDGLKVVEFEEDFSVWLTDFEQNRLEGQRYAIKFKIKIEPPSLLKEGRVLAQKDVASEFPFEPKIMDTDAGFLKFIKAKIKDLKAKEDIQAMQIGRLAADEIKALLAAVKR